MKAFAIKDPKGIIIASSIRFTETQCESNYSSVLKEMGYRCVPVEINEIKK